MNCKTLNAKAVNTTAQTLAANTNAVFGSYSSNGCGISAGTNGITIKRPGTYLITLDASGAAASSDALGNITMQIMDNGVAVPGAVSSCYSGGTAQNAAVSCETVITVLNSCSCIDNTAVITAQNAGIGAVISNVNMTAVKVG